MAERLIEVLEVVAGYAQPVIGPFSLRVDSGEIVGLVGPNGSGKSTVLRAITRTATVFSGEIQRASGLRVAHQHQNPVRLDEMPLRGLDLLGLIGADGPGAPDAVTALARRRLDELSGGQFQLVHVWAALAGPASLVLLDEPTNNMDPDALGVVARALAALEPSRAVVLVSHERPFLEEVCTRIEEVGTA